MKRLLTVLVALIALASPRNGHAGRIEGKWGLSAPVVAPAVEFSLIRGTSNGAWILDANLNAFRENQDAVPPTGFDAHVSTDETNWRIGPRWRRYSRPDAEFSSFVDVFVHGTYQRQATAASIAGQPTGGGTQARGAYGFSTGLALGVELFTKWGMGVAVSSQVAQITWRQTHNRTAFGTNRYNYEGSSLTVGLQFTPRVYVRGYW